MFKRLKECRHSYIKPGCAGRLQRLYITENGEAREIYPDWIGAGIDPGHILFVGGIPLTYTRFPICIPESKCFISI
jgi:hypothetical protein